ncbi:hypothetical protein [Pseudomonas sp. CGJS7]|uniref:hypothetical protein n=1 Tax=Pseudomonas sp. CGJS7 TaxID=3109348 RepID=UPI003008E196
MHAKTISSSVRGLGGAIVSLAALAAPSAAWAMQKCPEEFGPKPEWFMALGLAMLIVFAIVGAVLPWLAWRCSKTHRVWRWVWLALALVVAMPATWMLGLLLYLTVFVLPC